MRLHKKYRIPKKIILCGKEWVVRIDKKARGGWFSSDKGEIVIGIKDFNVEEIHQIFLHEVIEGVLSYRLLRYKLPYDPADNGHYLFNFNHREFENTIVDVNLALKGIWRK